MKMKMGEKKEEWRRKTEQEDTEDNVGDGREEENERKKLEKKWK